MPSRLPCIVLAGSDPFSGAIPTGLKREDMLTGYKGAQRLPVKRCLAGELVERLKQSDRFEGPILVGPRRIYEGEVDCQVVNAEGDILTTLRTALQFVRARFNFSSPVAFSTCDILPTPNEIRQLLDFCYAPHEGSPFWWQMVEAEPASLGAGAWKRPYRIRPEVGEPPKNLYPGHLVIARPSALRIELANRVLELMYRYRNREVRKRHFPMIARGLGTLVREDFHDLLSLKLPILTVSIPFYAIRGSYRLRHEILTMPEVESAVAMAFVRSDFRRATLGRPVVFTITPILSFAKDIDTKAELAEVA